MCGVHPNVAPLLAKIQKAFLKEKDWRQYLKNKKYRIVLKKYQVNGDKSLNQIKEELRTILKSFLKEWNPKKFRGFYVFPEHIHAHLPEIWFTTFVGCLLGGLFSEETNYCGAEWYRPQGAIPERKKIDFDLTPPILIMMFEKK